MSTSDLVWTLVSFLLTLLVFSYVFGDNFFFRVVSYVFVGVSAGYVFVVAYYQVIYPRLIAPLFENGTLLEKLLLAIVLILSALLLTKISPRFASWGRLPMAYLVGVGAAVTVGGAVFGTLMGQIQGAASPFNLLASGGGFTQLVEGVIFLLGTIGTLVYFQFSAASTSNQPAKRAPYIEWMALIGQVFIGMTLGALFAGVYAASMTALMERLGFLFTTIANLKF
jgi:hypothetical protein